MTLTRHNARRSHTLLSGAVITVFAVLVVGIHAGDRHQLTSAPASQLEAFTRNAVGLGVRTSFAFPATATAERTNPCKASFRMPRRYHDATRKPYPATRKDKPRRIKAIQFQPGRNGGHHAPSHSRPDDRNPKGNPMTSYLLIALPSPAERFVASARVTGQFAGDRAGWAGPGK